MSKHNLLNIDKRRDSNIEILRIISMFLIIAHHFSVHGGFKFLISDVSINKFWIQFLQLGGKIGVNIFVLISGYFLINTKKVQINKILKLWIQIFMYSIVIFQIFISTGFIKEIVPEDWNNFFPITQSRWWFASTYFILYLIFPYINKLLTNLDKRTYLKMIILTTFLWVVIPTISNSLNQCDNLIWFIYLYAVAGYIKLHLTNLKEFGKKPILIAILFFFSYVFIKYYFKFN